jgi:hypothetical protein
MKNFDSVKSVKRKIESHMLTIKGVHGISIGEDKAKPGEFCIYLHLEPGASTDEIPSEIEGVRITISVEERPVAQNDTGLYRPLIGGCQVEAFNLGYGTLGCLVKDRQYGKTCVLSNQHVLGYTDTIVGQPTLSGQIGQTIRSSGSSDLVDGAIAEISKSISYEAGILDIGPVTGTYDVTPKDILGDGYAVSKRGRTTGLSHSYIKRLDHSGHRSDGWNFKNQLYLQPPFAEAGDSGSVYVDAKNRVVGLHWGGSNKASQGSPIADVLKCLHIDMLITSSVVADLHAKATL